MVANLRHRRGTLPARARAWGLAVLASLLVLALPPAAVAADEATLEALPTTPWAAEDWAAGEVEGETVRTFEGLRVEGRGPVDAHVRAIPENVEAWWTRWWLLNKAETSIDITYFIVEDDVFGLSLLGLLARKARQGVRIRFMIDSRGSKALGSVFWGRGYLKELSKLPNVDIRVFNPLTKALLRLPKDLRFAIASNHDKLVIVDDEWVLTGGRNIGVEYFADPRDRKDIFRDTDILMRGREVTAAARQAFDEEFDVLKNDAVYVDMPAWSSRAVKLELARQIMDRYVYDGTIYSEDRIGKALRPLARDLHEQLQKLPRLGEYRYFEPFPRSDPVPVMVLDKHSRAQDKRNDITPNLVKLIDAAEHHIVIQNPYVVLTRDMGEALIRASKRGVRILLLTNSPKAADSVFVQAFFVRDWKKMMVDMPTLRIFAFEGPHPIHAKVFLFDDRVSVIGTYNMDPLSQAINSEVVAVVEDEAFTRTNRLRIAEDLANSIEYKIQVDERGKVKELVGPEKYLRGWSGFLTRLIGNLGFLKRLV